MTNKLHISYQLYVPKMLLHHLHILIQFIFIRYTCTEQFWFNMQFTTEACGEASLPVDTNVHVYTYFGVYKVHKKKFK